MYEPLPTNVRPMKLDVTSEEFVSEWGRCILNKKSDITTLLEIVDPFIKNWEKLLRERNDQKDISYVTLQKLLSKDKEHSLVMIDSWIQWADSTSTVENELLYLFIERVRRFKYYPSLAQPGMVEYVIARDYKLSLKHFIKRIHNLKNRDALLTAVYGSNYDEAVIQEYPDPFILNKDKLTAWHLYLLNLIVSNYNTVERSELTHIHRRNLYIEERTIWDSLRQRLLGSLAPEEP